jgi:fatty-acyl-CoA synthase
MAIIAKRPSRSFIHATTLGDLVDEAADESDNIALVFPECSLSYPELSEITDLYARALLGCGVQAGDKVGLLMPNQVEFVATLIGAAKLGAVVVPINGRFRAFELGTVIAHADIRVLVTARGPEGTVDYPAMLEETLGTSRQDHRRLSLTDAPLLHTIVDLTSGASRFMSTEDFLSLAAEVPESELRKRQERVKVRDVALLMYTSGTTAQPKGCLLTHEALVRHAQNVATTRFRLTSEDRFWDPLPLFHIGGIVPMLGCFGAKARYCHAGHFDPEIALRMLEEHEVTVAYPAFEAIWLPVLNHPRFNSARLESLRLIQNIAVPEKLVQMQELMPSVIEVSSFGATECSSNLTLPYPDDDYETRMYTLGTPLEGMEVKIVDSETRAELPAGTVGELAFRGYALFSGYYKDPERTSESIDEGGWFYSGDLGCLDHSGRLTYHGRLKDMLKVGGENVSALEVEDYLCRHPAVEIVQVVGAPDAKYGEVPVAYIQVKKGHTLAENDLIRFCIDQIASFKVPRYCRFVDEWPMSGTKIQKFVLRERIADELHELGIREAPPARELLRSEG